MRSSAPAIETTIALTRAAARLVGPPSSAAWSPDLARRSPTSPRFNRGRRPAAGEQTRLFASCQNDVIVPWPNEKVPDPQFPAKATVAEEGARALPGLSGESRSGDATASGSARSSTPAT